MLKSIRQFDKKKREGILSEIALELGRPSFGEDYSFDYFSAEIDSSDKTPPTLLSVLHRAWGDANDVRFRTVEEIVKRLNLKNTDHLYEAKSKLLEFVGREIRGSAIESGHISSVRKRLGQKGMLSPNAYQIKFNQDYYKLCEPLGITKNEIRQVIESPDIFEHFIPEVVINETFEAISLYVKTYSKCADPYSVLVDTRRAGDELSVHFALKVFHSDVDISDVSKPTDLLKTFTDKFGSEITIDEQSGRLILNKSLDARTFRLATRISQPHTLTRLSYRALENGKIEVAIAYGVDLKLYAESLRLHRVKVEASY